jgi:hypothetical protein
MPRTAKTNPSSEAQEAVKAIRVTPPNFGVLSVTVRNSPGSELVTHRRGPGSDISNPDIVKPPKGEKRPTRQKMEELRHACYEIPGKTDLDKMLEGKAGFIGLPASGFAKAMATLAKDSGDRTTLNATQVTRNIFVLSDFDAYVKVDCAKGCHMREDIVMIGKGTNRSPQMRYRPGFPEWETKLRIRFDADVFTPEDVMNLLARAGQKIGWGELRPEKGYSCGMWDVDYDSAQITINKPPKK